MTTLFIAGAGTDVGKTYVAARLVRALRAAGRSVLALKPVASGAPAWDDPAFADSDTGVLLAAQGLTITREAADACTPWRFRAPISPDMAAAREGRTVTVADLVAFHEAATARAPDAEVVLVESAGGVMSPAAADGLCLDWAAALGAPVLLVGGGYLGAVSHTLTACEALARRGLPLHAVVLSESGVGPVSIAETAAAVRRWCDAPVSYMTREPPAPRGKAHAG